MASVNETLRTVKTNEYVAYFFALGKFFRPFEFMLCVQIVIKVQETVWQQVTSYTGCLINLNRTWLGKSDMHVAMSMTYFL